MKANWHQSLFVYMCLLSARALAFIRVVVLVSEVEMVVKMAVQH